MATPWRGPLHSARTSRDAAACGADLKGKQITLRKPVIKFSQPRTVPVRKLMMPQVPSPHPSAYPPPQGVGGKAVACGLPNPQDESWPGTMVAEPQMADVNAIAAQEYPTLDIGEPTCKLNGAGCAALEVRAGFRTQPECTISVESDITITAETEVITFSDSMLTLKNPLVRPEPPKYPDLRQVRACHVRRTPLAWAGWSQHPAALGVQHPRDLPAPPQRGMPAHTVARGD